MQLMIQTFHKYSGNEGDKYTLSRQELKEMLTQELGNYLGVKRDFKKKEFAQRKYKILINFICISLTPQNAQDKDAVDKVMGDLDSNNDGEVDFTEFIILVGALTVACNDFFLEYHEKDGKKDDKKQRRICLKPTHDQRMSMRGMKGEGEYVCLFVSV